MDAPKPKKDSVFSGIFPSSEPAPPPPPASHAPAKPAVSEEQVAQLNKKIESMGRDIVGLIEKKLAEQPPPAPSKDPELGAAVIAKIAEMEARVRDFQEKVLLGAAQAKNIEESKISARREIEELLKVVREQQKYSELDRQMHDQLEKAWVRVEEMEKRLLDFYGTISNKPPQAVITEELAAGIAKIVEAALEERLRPLEQALKASTEKIGSVGLEARVRDLTAKIDERLAGFDSQLGQLRAEMFAGKERMEDILAETKKDLAAAVREAFDSTAGTVVKQVDGAVIDWRERLDVFSRMMLGHVEDLASLCRKSDAKLDALGSCVKSENARAIAAAAAMKDELERALRAGIADASAAARAENARQLENIREIYNLSASSLTAMSGVSENISAIEERMAGVSAALKGFSKGLGSVNMESLLGVSGAMIRRSFESVQELTAELEKELRLLSSAKGEIAATIKSVNERSGGGGK